MTSTIAIQMDWVNSTSTNEFEVAFFEHFNFSHCCASEYLSKGFHIHHPNQFSIWHCEIRKVGISSPLYRSGNQGSETILIGLPKILQLIKLAGYEMQIFCTPGLRFFPLYCEEFWWQCRSSYNCRKQGIMI